MFPTSIVAYDYAAGVAGAITLKQGVSSGDKSIQLRSNNVDKPYIGQSVLTVSQSDNLKTRLRNRKLSWNVPRLTTPAGVNPSTGLPYAPFVNSSITVTLTIIAPELATTAEVQDAWTEVSWMVNNNSDIRNYLSLA